MIVNSNFGGNIITVTNNAVLGGTGSVGAANLTIATGGTLMPSSNGAGIITITNTFRIDNGTLAITINSTNEGDYGMVKVSAGIIYLTNSPQLIIQTGASYTPFNRHKFWIINNLGSGVITGSFAGLPEGSVTNIAGRDFNIYYHADYNSGSTSGGNDLLLAIVDVQAPQTITNFPNPGTQYTTNTIHLYAQASSGLPVTNFTVISGPAVISDLTNMTFTGAGTVVVTADQPGNEDWLPAPTVTNTFDVIKATAEVIVTNLNQFYDGFAKTVSVATVPGGLTVDITYDGNNWAPTNAGTYAVTALVSDVMYQGTATASLVINKGIQLISNFLPPDGSVFSILDTVGLSAQANSGLSVTNFTVLSGPGNITGLTNLSFSDTGIVVVVANRAGNENWEAASIVTNSYTIVPTSGPPIMGATVISNITANNAWLGGSIVSSNGYTVAERGVYWGTNDNMLITTGIRYYESGSFGNGVFSFFVTNLPAGTNLYFMAYAVNGAGTSFSAVASFTTRPEAPVILNATNIGTNYFWANWMAVQGATNYYLDVSPAADFSSYFTGYSNLYVGTSLTYEVNGLDYRKVYYYRVRANNISGVSSNSEIAMVEPGLIAVMPDEIDFYGVYQGGDPSSQLIVVTNFGGSPFVFAGNVSYLSGAGGWLNVEHPTQLLVAGEGCVGTASVSIAGFNAGNYAALVIYDSPQASNAPQYVFVSLVIDKAIQSITNFPNPGDQIITNVVHLEAQASSGLPVTNFVVVSGPAVITGLTNLSFTGTGIVQVAARQDGNSNWYASAWVTNTFNVSYATASITLLNLNQTYDGSQKVVGYSTIPPGLTAVITYDGSTTPPVVAGIYAVTGTVNDGTYYGTTNGMLSVNKANQTITSFTPIDGSIFTITSFVQLAAQASSGLLVTNFSVVSGPGIISNLTNLIFNAHGTVTVAAVQDGNGNWNATPVVTNTYYVVEQTSAPTMGSAIVSNILASTAYLGGSILATNSHPVTERGIYWGTNAVTLIITGTRYYENGNFGTGSFSFFVTNLPVAQQIYFVAYAINAAGIAFTPTSSFVTIPAAPAVQKATNCTLNSFYANWLPAMGATNYYLDVSPAADFSSYLAGYSNLIVGTALTWQVTGLVNKADYYYRLRAENGAGTSTNSDVMQVSAGSIEIISNVLYFSAVYGDTNTYQDTVIISNKGDRPFYFGDSVMYLPTTITNWLVISYPTNFLNGEESCVANLTVSGAGLSVNNYYAIIAFYSDEAANTPEYLYVSLDVDKLSQTINFPPIPDQLTTNVVILSATASSGLPVSFDVISGSAVITNATNLIFTGAGTVGVVARQDGSSNYYAASPVTNTFNVTKAAAAIILTNLEQYYDGSIKTVQVSTIPAGLNYVVTYDGSTSPPINAASYVVNCTIYDPIYDGTTSDVLLISKASQTINFPPISDQWTTSKVTLAATASSGLPVSFSVGSGPAVITGGVYLYFTDQGIVSIVASQAGNSNYNAAPNVTNTFAVRHDTNTATLIVEVTPASGGWTITGLNYSLSGQGNYGPATITQGTYTITYTPMAGYETPPSETKTVAGGGILYFSATFLQISTNVLAPINVSASDGTYTNKIRITWQGSPQDTGYEIWRSTYDPWLLNKVSQKNSDSQVLIAEISKVPHNLGIEASTTNYYDDYNVEPIITYYYAVRAKRSYQISLMSIPDVGYRGIASNAATEKADIRIYDVVFLPINFSTNQTAGTISCRLQNKGPAPLNNARLAFDIHLTNNLYTFWMGTIENNYTIEPGSEVLVKFNAYAKQKVFTRGNPASGVYNAAIRVRHLSDLVDPDMQDNIANAVGKVTLRKDNIVSPSRAFSDFDGDGKADFVIYRTSDSMWMVLFSGYKPYWSARILGTSKTYNVPADFDGDGLTDMAVFLPSDGRWQAVFTGTGIPVTFFMGNENAIAVPCDFDGDGISDPTTYYPVSSYWNGASSLNQYKIEYIFFGAIGYEPVVADYDGDGKVDPGVYSEENGEWIVGLSCMSYQEIRFMLGGPGYRPCPADYDGDSKADPFVYNSENGSILVMLSKNNYEIFGATIEAGGMPLVADIDGDGKMDPTIYIAEYGQWISYQSSKNYQKVITTFGGIGYLPAMELSPMPHIRK